MFRGEDAMYTPPFTVSAKAINLISEISANLERFVIRMESEDGIRLRKVNRMKTIHGTLAIEGNTLIENMIWEIRRNIIRQFKIQPMPMIQGFLLILCLALFLTP